MMLRFTAKVADDGKVIFGKDHPVPQPDANQHLPRGFYVYAHCDSQGHVFYIGKGIGRRAWSRERHPLWVRYVEKHLGGEYEVRILADNLNEEEAEEMEASFMGEYKDLINWQNMGRHTNCERLSQCYDRQKANQLLIGQAKAMENEHVESAVELYLKAIENVKGYDESMYRDDATTILGQLQQEEDTELGHGGRPEGLKALDRVTLCLIRLKRIREASERVEAYFALYPRDRNRTIAKRIVTRIGKSALAGEDHRADKLGGDVTTSKDFQM